MHMTHMHDHFDACMAFLKDMEMFCAPRARLVTYEACLDLERLFCADILKAFDKVVHDELALSISLNFEDVRFIEIIKFGGILVG